MAILTNISGVLEDLKKLTIDTIVKSINSKGIDTKYATTRQLVERVSKMYQGRAEKLGTMNNQPPNKGRSKEKNAMYGQRTPSPMLAAKIIRIELDSEVEYVGGNNPTPTQESGDDHLTEELMVQTLGETPQPRGEYQVSNVEGTNQNIPCPPKFEERPGEPTMELKAWIRAFNNYLIAARAENDSERRKISLVKLCIARKQSTS